MKEVLKSAWPIEGQGYFVHMVRIEGFWSKQALGAFFLYL
jgi:hypothetical protein